MNEMDYWAGTFGLVVFALVETVLFMWVFGADKAWLEMNEGGDFKIPMIFYYIMKFVTPVVLFILMIWWTVQTAIPTFLLEGVNPEDHAAYWGSRALMAAIFIGLLLMVRKAWKNHIMAQEEFK